MEGLGECSGGHRGVQGGPGGFKRQRTRQDLVETTIIAITAVTLLVVPRAL